MEEPTFKNQRQNCTSPKKKLFYILPPSFYSNLLHTFYSENSINTIAKLTNVNINKSSLSFGKHNTYITYIYRKKFKKVVLN